MASMSDMLGKVKLTDKAQIGRNADFPEGVFKCEFVGNKFIESTQGGMDRTEFYFKVLESSNQLQAPVGAELKVPFFKDKYNIGLKDICKFVQQTFSVEDITQMSYKEILESVDGAAGQVTTVTVAFNRDSEKALAALKEGKPYRKYNYSKFEGLE